MRFDEVKQCGIHCRELGPNVEVSIEPSATYEDLIAEGKRHFFLQQCRCSSGEPSILPGRCTGSKLPKDLKGRSWILGDYLHMHGLYPSKTKLFCVQVNRM